MEELCEGLCISTISQLDIDIDEFLVIYISEIVRKFEEVDLWNQVLSESLGWHLHLVSPPVNISVALSSSLSPVAITPRGSLPPYIFLYLRISLSMVFSPCYSLSHSLTI